MNYQILISKLQKLYEWFIGLDFTNPRILLTLGAVLILPFIAKYLVLTGILIGTCLAVSTLWMVEKSPVAFQRWIHNNPFMADMFLSTFAVVSIGSFLGSGLTLAIGFIVLDLLLSISLPALTAKTVEPTLQPA